MMNIDPISTPTTAGGCLTDCTISPALPMPYSHLTTAGELFLRHVRPSRTKVVALTRNDTSEAQRAAMEYIRSWRGTAAPEIEIGHGEISSATDSKAESEVQPCANSFTGTTDSHS
jgi:hypothetical protein